MGGRLKISEKQKKRKFHKIGACRKKSSQPREFFSSNLSKRQLVENCFRSDICSDMRSNEGRKVIKEPVKERYRHHHHLRHARHYQHHLHCHDHHRLHHHDHHRVHPHARQWRAKSDRGDRKRRVSDCRTPAETFSSLDLQRFIF